jgi:hypothetical protein
MTLLILRLNRILAVAPLGRRRRADRTVVLHQSAPVIWKPGRLLLHWLSLSCLKVLAVIVRPREAGSDRTDAAETAVSEPRTVAPGGPLNAGISRREVPTRFACSSLRHVHSLLILMMLQIPTPGATVEAPTTPLPPIRRFRRSGVDGKTGSDHGISIRLHPTPRTPPASAQASSSPPERRRPAIILRCRGFAVTSKGLSLPLSDRGTQGRGEL